MELKTRQRLGSALAGLGAGCVNGIFGAAGGMILIPVLGAVGKISEQELFPMSVCTMLPVCVLTLALSAPMDTLPWSEALPYLIGGGLGGVAAGLIGKRLSVLWLHRIFGIMILWGGIRYLW